MRILELSNILLRLLLLLVRLLYRGGAEEAGGLVQKRHRDLLVQRGLFGTFDRSSVRSLRVELLRELVHVVLIVVQQAHLLLAYSALVDVVRRSGPHVSARVDFPAQLQVVATCVQSLRGTEHCAVTRHHVLLADCLLLGLLGELPDRRDVLNIVGDRGARVEILLVGLVFVLGAAESRVYCSC